MLKDLKSIFLVCAALGILLQVPAVEAASLKSIQYRPASVAGKTSDTPVIIHFKDRIDIDGIRRKVAKSIQGRGMDKKTLRLNRRQMLRASIVDNLKRSNQNPVSTIMHYLAQKGIARDVKPLWGINAIAASLPAHLIEEISTLQVVDRISYDQRLMMANPPSAPPTGLPLWNLEDVNAPDLWSKGITGQGVVVGVMDSGVDLNHPDLVERWRGGDNSWFDPYGQHSEPVDLNGHGTQTTGLMVGGDASGYQVGVAPGAQWIAARIFNDSNQVTLSAIHEAFQWMLDPDNDQSTDDAPDVVNNSWGFGDRINDCNLEFSEDISLLKEAGIAVVFSAGNYGPESETSISPANDPSVVSVGSVDQLHEVETTSSRGPGACDGGIFPKLVAPGQNIYTTDLIPMEYNLVSGTSFAAPHVAGAMALLLSNFPFATVSQIETALLESARDLGVAGADDNHGYGLLDIAGAYNWLSSVTGDTSAGMLMFSENTYSIDETTAVLTVTVNRIGGSSGEISVDYETIEDTAFADVDYTSTVGTLVFLDGETSRSFEVIIKDDDEDETNESFNLKLSNPEGGAILGHSTESSVTILDDDGPGVFAFESASQIVREDRKLVDVKVNRIGGREGIVEIDYATIDETAIGNLDYVAEQGTLLFEDGHTSNVISIGITDNELHEENKTFYLSLNDVSNGGDLTGPAKTKITIIDNDISPSENTIAMKTVSRTVREDIGEIKIVIIRQGKNAAPVSADINTISSSAKESEDFVRQTSTVYFSGTEEYQETAISIEILDDKLHESDEVFSITLSNPSEGTIIGKPSATLIKIVDNDTTPSNTTTLLSTDTSLNGGFNSGGSGGGAGSSSVSPRSTSTSVQLSLADISGVEVIDHNETPDVGAGNVKNTPLVDDLSCHALSNSEEDAGTGVPITTHCKEIKSLESVEVAHIEEPIVSTISDIAGQTKIESSSVPNGTGTKKDESVIDQIIRQIKEALETVRDLVLSEDAPGQN